MGGQIKEKKTGFKKCISIALTFAVAVSSIWTIPSFVEAAGNYGVSAPRINGYYRERVLFGSYIQEDTNGNACLDEDDEKMPISWHVLKKYSDGTALLLADRILDLQQYNSEEKDCKWENSTIRTWLNDDFYNTAFSADEKMAIRLTDVSTPDNNKSGTDGGNDTKDYVFLLTHEDLTNSDYGFLNSPGKEDPFRDSALTSFAKNRGGSGYQTEFDKAHSWWLRSPGFDADRVEYVQYRGKVVGQTGQPGTYVKEKLGVRPAIRVNLNSSLVKSDDSTLYAVETCEWDSIIFGKYDDKELSWKVLDVNGSDAFVVCDTVLKSDSFGNPFGEPWGRSLSRTWLNEDFYNDSFTNNEKSMIKTTQINDRGTTDDKVFILSMDDIVKSKYGFPRLYEHTSKLRGTFYGWILPGVDPMMSLLDDGTLETIYSSSSRGFRPAMHIDLSVSAWRKGDAIKINDTVRESGGSSSDDPYAPQNENKPDDKKESGDKGKADGKNESNNNKSEPSKVVPASDGKNKNSGSDIKVGTTSYDSKGLAKYKVTKAAKNGTGAVQYVAPKSKKKTSITIPDTVTIKGYKYKVTEVKANAFKGCKNLKKLVIGKNVSKIGKKALYGCKKLRTITIKTGKLKSKTVGAKAFGNTYKKVTVKVPKAKKKAYKKWIYKKGFKKTAKIK